MGFFLSRNSSKLEDTSVPYWELLKEDFVKQTMYSATTGQMAMRTEDDNGVAHVQIQKTKYIGHKQWRASFLDQSASQRFQGFLKI